MKYFQNYYLSPIAILIVLAFLTPSRVLANPISPGFDSLTTPDGTAFIDLGAFGLGPIIVPLEGDPIPGEGDADTIVERKIGLGDGETGTIDIELVALSLRSVDPVNIDLSAFGGPDSIFDIFLTLDDLQNSLGEMDIVTHELGGGTFSSFFDVYFEITLEDINSSFSITQVGYEFIGPPTTLNE